MLQFYRIYCGRLSREIHFTTFVDKQLCEIFTTVEPLELDMCTPHFNHLKKKHNTFINLLHANQACAI